MRLSFGRRISQDAAVSFEEVGRFSYPFEWGAEVVVCCKAVRLGVLAARRLKKVGSAAYGN